jgi:hypothetical protein
MASSLGQLYLDLPPTVPTTAEVQALRLWIRREYIKLPTRVYIVDRDISPQDMLDHMEIYGELMVSSANSDHPYLSTNENVMLRAVHDWHHLMLDAGFDLHGEQQTYVEACKTAPPSIHWLLFSEIVLQAAACILTGTFQQQKLVKLF